MIQLSWAAPILLQTSNGTKVHLRDDGDELVLYIQTEIDGQMTRERFTVPLALQRPT